MDLILKKPHPKLSKIKERYPHYYSGRSKQGSIVYYEECCNIDVPGLEADGITVDDLVWHYLWR